MKRLGLSIYSGNTSSNIANTGTKSTTFLTYTNKVEVIADPLLVHNIIRLHRIVG